MGDVTPAPDALPGDTPVKKAKCPDLTSEGVPCPMHQQINGYCIGHWQKHRPKEELLESVSKAGSAPKPFTVPLKTAKDVLIYCERLAADVSQTTVELADTKVRIAHLALKAQERMAAEKAESAETLNQRMLGRTG
jgi:hypothetical protein